MNLSIFIAALKAAALSAASSIGAAFLSGLSVIGAGFLADERAIGAACLKLFHDKLDEGHAAGLSPVDAIEQAATAALNKFCADEKAEFSKECSALITLAVSSAQSAAGL